MNDSVTPSPNGILAENLFLLSRLLGRDEYNILTNKALGVIVPLVEKNPLNHAGWARQIQLNSEPFYEVIITGKDALLLGNQFRQACIPHTITAMATSLNEENLLFKGRFREGETFIYICMDKSCSLPLRSVEEAWRLIKR